MRGRGLHRVASQEGSMEVHERCHLGQEASMHQTSHRLGCKDGCVNQEGMHRVGEKCCVGWIGGGGDGAE